MEQQKSVILKPTNLQVKALEMSSYEHTTYLKEIWEALKDNSFIETIKTRSSNDVVYEEFEFKDGQLYSNEFLHIPLGSKKLNILQTPNGLPFAGHFGFNETLELLSRKLCWPQMWKLVKKFNSHVLHAQD